jgi:hypothetical protein
VLITVPQKNVPFHLELIDELKELCGELTEYNNLKIWDNCV